ncbi:MAG: hypothetical protein U0469_01495 [Candidatus Paceibacterota bacterium]|jgi:hypothetical protein
MKKIGEGYYYNVYDIGNGRVFKKLKSNFRIFLFILISRSFNPDFIREYINTKKNIKITELKYKKLVKILKDLSLIGNPNFFDGSINYEQDKVLIVKKILKKYGIHDLKMVLDNYIELIKKSWEFGFSEISFNFTVNCGVLDGRIIFIDFNEITFSIEDVKKDIENQIWLHRWSFSHLNKELKEYYKKRMEEELTVENLEKLWNVRNI